MSLNRDQRQHLKKLAHPLNPVVMVGQAGITPGVVAEMQVALDHHELIKVRISAGDRDERDEMVRELIQASGAELVQRIGNVATLFRRNPKKTQPLALPND